VEKICLIIPAYNEEPRIGAVLDVVTEINYLSQIIVVDDGSRDQTEEVSRRYPVKTLRHDHNRGKGAALQTGLNASSDADYFLFLDADLIGLEKGHLDKLLQPLRENKNAKMSIGIFRGSQVHVDLAQNIFSILNGQRAFKRELIEELPDLSWARFGVEIFLNRYCEMIEAEIEWIPLQNITHWTKEQKFGLIPGFLYRLQMYRECLKCLFTYQKKIEAFSQK